MTEQEYAKVVARNLRRLAFINDKTQMDMSRELGINQSTLSSWMNGNRTPKMSKIDMFCRYFNCQREDIMEPHGNDNFTYGERLVELSGEDRELLKAYAAADEGIRNSVRILLGINK